jgi:hypothetical protein
LFVRLKVADVATPATDAVTLKLPGVPFATGIAVVASPLTSVMAVVVADPPNVARAPVDGAVNVTVIPDSGLAAASVTFACNALLNVVATVVTLRRSGKTRRLTDGAPAAFVKMNKAVLHDAGNRGRHAVCARRAVGGRDRRCRNTRTIRRRASLSLNH